MNKRKTQNKAFKCSEVVLLTLAAALVTAGGVCHAIIKNKQVQVTRQIEESHRRTDTHNNDAMTIQVQVDRKVNRFVIKESLESERSELRETAASQIEIVTQPESESVATIHSP